MRRAAAHVDVVERRPLHLDRHAYCAHPHMAVCADGTWLVVFNRAPRRAIVLHPPQDPEYRNVMMRSHDEGRSWSAPAVVPHYDAGGTECAGLTALRSGRILLNQWRFEWLPLPAAERSGRADLTGPAALMAGLAASPELDAFVSVDNGRDPGRAFPWTRGGGEALVHVSDDQGATFEATHRIDTAPFSGGYGMRGGVELPDGDILLPLSDVPNYRQVFVVRSSDRGATWSKPLLAASGRANEFEEPAPLVLPSGRILMMLRDNASRMMHTCASDDGGIAWTTPRPTGIAAYPAHLLALPDGRLACVAGRREPPFGIVLHLSDDGETWSGPLALVDDLPSKDLGYPTAALRRDGDLVVVFYARGTDGITGIHSLTARLSPC